MNCLAHAYRFLHDPYLAAGTGVPDWLSMADRKTRVRRKEVNAFLLHQSDSSDQRSHIKPLATGILQHIADDDWFHVTPAFATLNQQFSAEIAACLGTEDGHRSGFLAHILVELLLDSAIAEEHPSALPEYYRALEEIDPARIQQTINQIARRPTDRLIYFLPVFRQEKFLYDYLEDRTLLRRLNGIMQRVGLPALPTDLLSTIAASRSIVRKNRVGLLTASALGTSAQ